MRRQIIRGFIGVGALRAYALVVQMLSSVFSARLLGPSSYGLLTFAMAMASLWALPASSGLVPLVIRETAKIHAERNWAGLRSLLGMANRWSCIGGMLAVLALVLSTLLFSSGFELKVQLVLISSVFIPFWALIKVRISILQGIGRVVAAQAIDWGVVPTVYLIFLLCLFWSLPVDPRAVAGCGLAATVVGFCCASFLVQQSFPAGLNHKTKIPLLKWAKQLFPLSLLEAVNVANAQIDVALLGVFGSNLQVGLFKVAESAAGLISISLVIVNAVIAPHIVSLHKAGDRERLQRLAQTSARAAFFLSLPVVTLLTFSGEWVIRILFGEEYREALTAMLIMLVGQIVNVGCGSVGLLLNMSGYEKDTLWALSIALILNGALCAFLASGFGEKGAAAASAVSLIMWNLLLLVRVRMRLGIRAAIV